MDNKIKEYELLYVHSYHIWYSVGNLCVGDRCTPLYKRIDTTFKTDWQPSVK